jgi:hypothetical protein
MRYDAQQWSRLRLIAKFQAEVLVGALALIVGGLPLLLTADLTLAKGLLASRFLNPSTLETWFFLPMAWIAFWLTLGLISWWTEQTCRRWAQRYRLDISNALLSVPFINSWIVGGKLLKINIRPPSSRR